jgi:hypothetical protein
MRNRTWRLAHDVSAIAAAFVLIGVVSVALGEDGDDGTTTPGTGQPSYTFDCVTPCSGKKTCPSNLEACCCNSTGAWVCSCKTATDCMNDSTCQ